MPAPWEPNEPDVLARVPGVAGGELVLRGAGEHYEIISNGVFLMDTRDGASERAMVRSALATVPAERGGLRVLVAGLGVGFSAREALDAPGVALVRVVEVEPRVIEWHHGPLGPVAGHLPRDPRCDIRCADFVDWLAARDREEAGYDVACLDIDNGPDWTVSERNARLYRPETLERLKAITRPGGTVAFWSAAPAPRFVETLAERFATVRTLEVPARRGDPDVVYLARRDEPRAA